MNRGIDRREFLGRSWKAGVVMIGCAGAWTSWDLLRPLPGSGLGGVIETVPEGDVTAATALYVRAAKTYLTRIDDEVVAIWQKCPHLGCRVSWCEGSGQFECACHGSYFNRAGEYRSGPAPRGMDRFAATVNEDGIVAVDTGAITQGAPSGTTETLDEPPRGESCI
jgi:cytochrome b6-f complex iron-sulfur subunit